MAIDFNGTTQYLSASSTLLLDEPIDLIAHASTDNNTAVQGIVSINNTGAANGWFALTSRGDLGGDPVSASKTNDAGGGNAALTSSGFSLTTWEVYAAAFLSNTSRAVYINGGSKGTDATNVTDPTPNSISIGAIVTNALLYGYDGRAAEVYVLNVNMSDSQHAARGKGYSALWDVPIKNVRGWYPLLRTTDLQNRMANGYPTLTATASPAQASHPSKVIYPRIGALICL